MAIMKTTNLLAAGAALTTVFAAGQADALTQLKFNMDSVTGTITGAGIDGTDGTTFDAGETFTVTLSENAGTSLILNPTPGASTFFPTGAQISGTINATVLGAGALDIDGGSFIITSPDGTDTYSATISSATTSGTITANSISLVGVTFAGTFTSDTGSDFAGVDLTGLIGGNGFLGGTFSEINLTLDDPDSSQFQALVVIPSPSAALAAIPMLGLLATRRRRNG